MGEIACSEGDRQKQTNKQRHGQFETQQVVSTKGRVYVGWAVAAEPGEMCVGTSSARRTHHFEIIFTRQSPENI